MADEYDSYDFQNVDADTTSSNTAADDYFDQDWADVTGGRFTIDEVTNNQDITANADLAGWGSDWSTALKNIAGSIGQSAFKGLKNTFTKKDAQGKDVVDWAALATAGVGLYNMNQKNSGGGYNKPVPKVDMVRQQVAYDDTNRRPGEAGRQYFTDSQFVAQTPEAREAANAAATTQAQGLAAIAPRAAPVNKWEGKYVAPWEKAAAAAPPPPQTQEATMPEIPQAPGYAYGGITQLAKGGRYLDGKTDGMADKIPTTIDGEQKAALSHGEFVIPADVVSHLGNGNSEAGAEKLYSMMARIRKARTGTEEQGKRINPDKFMPGGLAAAYAAGGSVQNFNVGGPTTVNPTTTGAGGIPNDVSRTSTLSPWVGDYVTGALGEGAAAANAPYQAYKGPLTAGSSDLQQQQFAGLSGLAQSGFTPTTFNTGTFDAGQAQKYMNPYLQSVLDPQMKEMTRQADIQRVSDAGRLTKAGAFGGSRQAIMESEGNRNLLGKQTEALGTGYKNAYDSAMGQFNAEQGRNLEAQGATEKSRQYSSDFGLKSLAALGDAGAVQRGITGEGIAADKTAFEEQRDYALKAPQYKLNLLQGLPIGANTTSVNQDALSKMQSDIAGLGGTYKTLNDAIKALGIK